jgi:hypothetical protein
MSTYYMPVFLILKSESKSDTKKYEWRPYMWTDFRIMSTIFFLFIDLL